MNTIHDVAKLAGVSTGTVSNVINNNHKVAPQTAERVKKAIEELQFIPNTLAKSLKMNTSRIIGVLAEDISAFSSGDIIDGICEYCETHDYTINLCNLRVNRKVKQCTAFLYKELEESPSFLKDIKTNINTLLTSRVCGLIYIGTYPRDVGHILPQLPIPVVYSYAYAKKEDYCINYDDYQGAKLAVDYLIEQGHEHIALLCGAVDSIPSHKRMMGYQAALMEHNLPFQFDYVRTGNWLYEDGYRNCLELLKLPKPPTAIFAMSDLMATGAMKALQEHGFRIPHDISIHGFDNIQLSEFTTPPLTTVNLPLHEMGMQSAQTMDFLLTNKDISNTQILLPCNHVIREST